MRTARRVVLSAGIATLVAITAPGISSLGPIDIGGYQLVSQVRVTRTIGEFTYRAALTNHGEALLEPTAVATSRSAATVLVDDTVAFGSVAAGATTLSRDTFSFRHDRTVPFDWSNIQWNLKAGDKGNHPPVANAGSDLSRAVGSTAQLNGSGSLDIDGDPLTYRWTLTTRPAGSAAAFFDDAAANPSFIVDTPGTYVAQLVVNDRTVDSPPDTVIVSTVNSAPRADAGSDQTAFVQTDVTLSAGRSHDVDGDPLTYRWTMVARAPASTAVLVGPTTVGPTFRIDRSGTYVAELVVNDGFLDSAVDTVVISTLNSAPVANAGPDQTVAAGAQVTLDGTASTDVDGNQLTYRWSLTTQPNGSVASLSASSAAQPTFTADLPGAYIAQLIVFDGTVDSTADTATIETVEPPNRQPVADPGPHRSVRRGAIVELDGRGSSDPDGHALTFAWSLLSKPDGSAAQVFDPTAAVTSFDADADGTYVVQLIVNDGFDVSEPRTVTMTTENLLPVANAGPDQTAALGATIRLDGSSSSDPEGASLQFFWSLIARPAGSTATLSDPAAVNPAFVADAEGVYVAQLILGDGVHSSDPDTVTVTVQTGADLHLSFFDPPSGTRAPGATVIWRVDIRNEGPAATDDVVVHVALPAGYAVTGTPAPSAGAYDLASGVWTVGSLDRNGLRDLRISATVNAGGSTAFAATIDHSSQPDPDLADNTITAPAINRPPVADAGPDRPATSTHSAVTLDGTQSSDAEGDALAFEWAFTLRPVNSTAAFDDARAATPSFVPDQGGPYVARLTVTDPHGATSTDMVTITAGLGLSNVQEEPGRATSALMTPEGGALTVTGGNGVVYTLTVPEGALEEDTQIAMHPIANLKNLPAGESLSAGVHFTPEGLRFVTHATLTMQLPPSMNPNDLIGVAYEGNAEQTRLDLHSVNGQTVTMSVHHFSGKALGGRRLKDILPLNVGLASDLFRIQMSAHAKNISDPAALTTVLARVLREWYVEIVKPALQNGAAPTADAALIMDSILEYDFWLDGVLWAEKVTQTVPFPIEPELGDSEILAVNMMKRWYTLFNDMCLGNPNGDLTADKAKQNPLLAAGLALERPRFLVRQWNILADLHDLDDESLLDGLCAKVVIEKIEAAPGFGPGATESVGVTAGFTIAGGPVRRNPRIRVQFQPGSGIVTFNPSSVNTDSTGIAATLAVWDSSFSQATVKVLANINSVRMVVRNIRRFDQKTFSGPISPGSIDLFVNSRVTLCSTVRVSATVTGVAPGVTFTAPNITFTDFFTDGRETSAGFIPRISGPLTIRATSTADPSVTATTQTMVDPFVGAFGDGNPIVISGGQGTYTIDATGSGDRWVLAPQGNRFVGVNQGGTPLDLTVTDTHAILRGEDSEGNLFEFQVPRICR